MLELYEQNRVPPPSQTSEAEGSAGTTVSHRPPSKAPTGNDEHAPIDSMAQSGVTTSKPGTLKPASSRPAEDHPHSDIHGGHSKPTQNRNNDYGSSAEVKSVSDQKGDGEVHESEEPQYQENIEEEQNRCDEEDQARNGGRAETREAGEMKDRYHGYRDGGTVSQSPQEAIKKIDKDKVKAALEKRRKARGDTTRKTDLMDEDDLIERELEDGIELAAETDKVKHERRTNWSKPSKLPDHEKGQHSHGQDSQNVEEGEVAALDDVGHGYRSPKSSNRKRKAGSPPDRPIEGKQRSDYAHRSHHHSHHDLPDDRNRLARLGYTERDPKRHVQENHV